MKAISVMPVSSRCIAQSTCLFYKLSIAYKAASCRKEAYLRLTAVA